MIGAGLAAKGLLGTLGMMALQGTALAVIAGLVSLFVARVLRVRAPAWHASLWLVVLAKFALPWGPSMPWSFADLVASFTSSPAHALPVLDPTAAVVTVAPSIAPALGWLALAVAWAGGALFFVTRALLAQRAAVTIARRGTPVSSEIAGAFAELAAQMRVRRARLVVGDAATGPFVVGMLRPIVVVPPALVDHDADAAVLRAVLLHELAHVRRRDALGRAVQLVATSLFFFWPVVRIVARRLDLAREAACDAWALESSSVARSAYARTLVRMAALRTTSAASLAMPRSLDARITSVLGPPIRARLGLGHWIALAVWTVVALGGARSAAARGDTETCRFSPTLAEQLYWAHPEADLDGDGTLSRDEACELQAEVRRTRALASDTPQVSVPSEADAELTLLSEPLCCNCGAIDGTNCQDAEGVSR